MRKFWIIIGLIFILIAVSWFAPARCQDLDREELLKEYSQSKPTSQSDEAGYSSPEIYGEIPKSHLPADNPGGTTGTPDKKELQPFGYDLFAAPSDLKTPSEVANIDGYILGPGDNILIYLWGKVEKEFSLTVDRQGKIFIPKVGEVIVWGMTLDEFERKITKKLSQSYTDFEISVSLGKIRSIRIYMTGEVRQPGAYTVSSLTTLFNALYLAGGPNERGSMREIKLIRSNRIEAALDLYQFLLKGDSRGDLRLSSGDAVFIPVAGPRVAIEGEIKRPGIYELKGGENVEHLLQLAGGPTAEAFLERVMLDRISPNDEREVVDLNLNPDLPERDNPVLRDGDRMTLFSIYEMKRNVVAVAGMVKHPGHFERNDSTTLKTIIEQCEILPDNVYYERANLFRHYPDQRVEIIPVNLNYVLDGHFDMPLADMDSLHIYSVDEVERKKYVYIDGEIKRPGRYALYENMTVYDLIFLAGNLNKEASRLNVELARADSADQIYLQKIDLNNADQAGVNLKEDDRVFVRRVPDWFRHRMVTIEGEVMFPGQYALLSYRETFYDLIRRAGGFTQKSFPQGTIFRRNTVGESLERQNISEIIANSQPLKEDSLGNIRQVSLLNFKPENLNRIIIDVSEIMASDGTEGNIPLQHGDYIYIPSKPSGISVMGAVGANGTIRFATDRNVRYYIKRAGNFSEQADKKRTRLIKADGRVYAGGSTLKKRVELGDAIVVPTRIKKDRDWLKILSTTVSIVGGIATSVFIIDRL